MIVYRDPDNGCYVERRFEGTAARREWFYSVIRFGDDGARHQIARYASLQVAISVCRAQAVQGAA